MHPLVDKASPMAVLPSKLQANAAETRLHTPTDLKKQRRKNIRRETKNVAITEMDEQMPMLPASKVSRRASEKTALRPEDAAEKPSEGTPKKSKKPTPNPSHAQNSSWAWRPLAESSASKLQPLFTKDGRYVSFCNVLFKAKCLQIFLHCGWILREDSLGGYR